MVEVSKDLHAHLWKRPGDFQKHLLGAQWGSTLCRSLEVLPWQGGELGGGNISDIWVFTITACPSVPTIWWEAWSNSGYTNKTLEIHSLMQLILNILLEVKHYKNFRKKYLVQFHSYRNIIFFFSGKENLIGLVLLYKPHPTDPIINS